MEIGTLRDVLLWSLVVNYAVLFVWFGAFVFAHEWMFRMHTRWFQLSRQSFDAIHYGGMAFYKIGILLLNLVPLIAVSVSAR